MLELARKEIGVTEINEAKARHCVYIHKAADSGVVFYVGRAMKNIRKNKFERPYAHRNRNKFWKAVAVKHGFRVEILAFFNTAEEADDEEKRLIAFYGKRMLGGLLCNLADGGQGNRGCPKTEEWKKRMSAKARGRKLTEEHREKLSKARVGMKLSPEHKAAIAKKAKQLKNFRLNDPDVKLKAIEARKQVKTKPRTPEHQEKINLANRGSKRTVESRLKMSLAAKQRRLKC